MDQETLVISLVGYAAFCGLMIVPLWVIFDRAGLPRIQALLFVVPLAGPLAVLWRLGFSRWPKRFSRGRPDRDAAPSPGG